MTGLALASLIVSCMLAIALLGSAAAKLAKAPQVVDSITGVGVPLRHFPKLAVVEIAGGLGLLAGLYWAPLGFAAAIGAVLYFLGAVTAHLRAKDGGSAPASFLLLLSAAALILRLLA